LEGQQHWYYWEGIYKVYRWDSLIWEDAYIKFNKDRFRRLIDFRDRYISGHTNSDTHTHTHTEEGELI
jgi:hypothetical protein